MTQKMKWCFCMNVNPMEVMRLIDLIADLDTPSASELRAFADRALVQVQTSSLRVGIATEGGRPIGDILSLVDGYGIKRDVWSISSIDRPTGVDAWIIVVGTDSDRAKERKFVERVGDMQKAVVVTGPDLDAASHLGVGAERIFGSDLTGLSSTIERWIQERDTIRSGVLAAHARPVIDALSRDQAALDAQLSRMPEAAEAKQKCDEFELRSTAALEALNTNGGQAIEEMREEVVRVFSDWVETVTANHGDRPNRDRVQDSLEKWLRDRFAASFSERISKRLGTQADQLPLLRQALAGMDKSQVAEFATPHVDVPEQAEPSRLRWLFPVAGGSVGFWRGGLKLGLIGAALGMVIARIMRKRAKRPLRDKALKTAAASHLASHLDMVLQRTTESLRADAALELERLKKVANEAERSKPERDRIHATLAQLAKARTLLA
jgi:hypothetical protein